MSIQHVSAVLECRDPRLSGCRKLVLVTLANRTDEEGRCWPSQERLSGECGISIRALSDHLKALEEDRFITRNTQHLGQGNGSRTIYQLHVSALEIAPEEFAPAETAPANSVACTGSTPLVTNHHQPSPSSDEPRKREPNGSRLPADWQLPDAWRREACAVAIKAKSPITDEEAENEADKFRDYWCAQPGVKGRKLDWLGTWRNWIRRAAPEIVRARSRAAGGASQRTGNGYGKPQSRFAPNLSLHDALALTGLEASDPQCGAGWEPDHGNDPDPQVRPPRLEVIDSADVRRSGAGGPERDHRNARQTVLPLPLHAVR